MDLNIEKDVEMKILKQVDQIMFILYPNYNKNTEIENITEALKSNDLNNQQLETALVVQKDFSILDPNVIFKIKKSLKLSLRSFFISISLTILNLFI